MAESYPPPDPDTEPPAVLGKMDALIARHRGSGVDPNVPVLTDLDPADAFGEIPVLTQVASVVGDDLMFTPDEIRAEYPADTPAAPAPQWRHSPDGPPTEVTSLPVVDEAPVLPDSRPIVPPPAATPRPAATLNPAPPVLDFPELVIPADKPAIAKPAPAPAPSPVSGPLMPELALNFDFSLPDEPATAPAKAAPTSAAPPSIAPASVVRPVAPPPQALAPAISATPQANPAPLVATAAAPAVPAAPFKPLAPAAPVAKLVSEEVPELSIELDAADEIHAADALPAPDPAELTAAILTSLKPEIEKLVRGELAKQIASLHVEVLKRTLGALQPQLDKLVSGKIEEVLKRR
ncbi:hypothetical protein [Chitinimonas sp.]|uniref:hypothetical protein n=1 Tax=Chitinimonas sp. TaxID=1934313 RepID=UPI002F95E2ED